MTFNNWTNADFLRLWLTIATFFVLLAAFGVYVYSEKQIDYANNQRLLSHILADQLRQSSDDLTRMARTYVVTGDLRYKNIIRRYWISVTATNRNRKVTVLSTGICCLEIGNHLISETESRLHFWNRCVVPDFLRMNYANLLKPRRILMI